MSNSDAVLAERHDSALLLTLNRPAARNAVDAALATALGRELAAADADATVRAVVLTGAGPAFCAGADLKKVRTQQPYSSEHPEWGFAGCTEHPVRMPLIAAINGPALGGGAEIALACDLIVMAEDAVIGLPEVQRGLIAGAGGLLRIPRQIPPRVASELVLTGRPLTAREAEHWGLVNRVVAADDLLPVALELAAATAANAPLAVAASRELMRAATGEGSPWDHEIWRRTGESNQRMLASTDLAEGTAAFAERRAPIWRGR